MPDNIVPRVPFLPPAQRRPPPAEPESESDSRALHLSRSDWPGAVILRLDGRLEGAGLGVVRLAILEEFASHARSVIVDLAGLTSLSPAGAAVFAAAAADCGGWPIVALALARPAPGPASQLRKSGASKYVVVRNSLEEAIDGARAGPRSLRDARELLPATAALEGRRFVADCCLRWGIAELAALADEAALPLVRAAAALTDSAVHLQVTYDRKSVLLRATLARHARVGDLPLLPAPVRSEVRKDGALVLSVIRAISS